MNFVLPPLRPHFYKQFKKYFSLKKSLDILAGFCADFFYHFSTFAKYDSFLAFALHNNITVGFFLRLGPLAPRTTSCDQFVPLTFARWRARSLGVVADFAVVSYDLATSYIMR